MYLPQLYFLSISMHYAEHSVLGVHGQSRLSLQGSGNIVSLLFFVFFFLICLSKQIVNITDHQPHPSHSSLYLQW